jgi:hypothetical protein
MPYTNKDVRHKTRKAKSSKDKRKWRHVYDSVIERGGSEASAIRQASGVVKRSKRVRRRSKSR